MLIRLRPDFVLQLPFSIPTANEALLVSPIKHFGPVLDTEQDQPAVKDGFTGASVDVQTLSRPFFINDPEPYLPEGFFDRLAQLREQYGSLYASAIQPPLEESRRKRPNMLSSSSYTRHRHLNTADQDHWLNWRDRMEAEVYGDQIDEEQSSQ